MKGVGVDGVETSATWVSVRDPVCSRYPWWCFGFGSLRKLDWISGKNERSLA